MLREDHNPSKGLRRVAATRRIWQVPERNAAGILRERRRVEHEGFDQEGRRHVSHQGGTEFNVLHERGRVLAFGRLGHQGLRCKSDRTALRSCRPKRESSSRPDIPREDSQPREERRTLGVAKSCPRGPSAQRHKTQALPAMVLMALTSRPNLNSMLICRPNLKAASRTPKALPRITLPAAAAAAVLPALQAARKTRNHQRRRATTRARSLQ